MAIIIEDGSGKTDAESYISLSDVDDYITRWHGAVAEWAAATAAAKEVWARQATRYIDSRKFKGLPRKTDQALKWPRYIPGYLIAGFVIESDEVPSQIVYATAEAIVRLAEGEDLQPDHDDAGVRRTRDTVGPITEEIEYMGGKRSAKTFSAIESLLAPFVISGRTLTRTAG